MPTYAVTGASGQFGRLAVLDLLDRGVPAADVIAIVRVAGKVSDLADRGVEVREGEYAEPATLDAALSGVDRLLFVSGSEAGQRILQHTNVVDAATRTGVSRIAYTSILNADDTTNPLAEEHQATERLLRDAGVPFTFLRNGWYTENYTRQLDDYLKNGEIVGAAGEGRISAAARHDYATAAVAALLNDQDAEQIYELGAPSFNLAELAATITEATGTSVEYRNLTIGNYVSYLQRAGMDHETAGFVAAIDSSIALGDLETDRDDLALLLGGTPVTLSQIVARAVRGRADNS